MLLRATIANLFSPCGSRAWDGGFWGRAPVAAACYPAPGRSSSFENRFSPPGTERGPAVLRTGSSSPGVEVEGESWKLGGTPPSLLANPAAARTLCRRARLSDDDDSYSPALLDL
jgi:hypothetical protein